MARAEVSMSSISALSVISSESIDGSTSDERIAWRTSSRPVGRRSCNAERFTARSGQSAPCRRVSARSSASACSSAHVPIGTIMPVSSATVGRGDRFPYADPP
jgi:hypothetical protein